VPTAALYKDGDRTGRPGEFITETLGYDGGRQVTAYVPADSAEAVVFAGDGQLIASWGDVLEVADLPPTMIIGTHRVEDETLRLHEYSPGRSTAAFAFDPQRFAAHEKFFTEDVRRWAATRLAVSRPNRGVRCLGRCGTRAGRGAAPSRHLRRGLLRLAWDSEPAARRAANATRWADAFREAGGTLSWSNGPARTATPSGNTSFR
jgi:hypothetical protein